MRVWLWLASAAIVVGAGFEGSEDELVLIFVGENSGYLTPCGCVKPMTGGIHRRGSAVGTLSESAKNAIVLDVGNWVTDVSRQSEIKAEALAESALALGTAAIRLSPDLVALGEGSISAVGRLSGAPVLALSGGLELGAASEFYDTGVLVTAILESEPDEVSQTAMRGFLAYARELSARAVVLTGFDLQQARDFARAYPEIEILTYRSGSSPPNEPIRQGSTTLVTVGDQGKYVVSVSLGKARSQYARHALDPAYSDDPAASAVYERYQMRVRDEDLIAQMPRFESPEYAGNKACMSCHGDAAKVWLESAHAAALKTLEDGLQDRDPDCLGCHVVGLDSTQGFESRKKTPDLADVGCESCHGPGRAHAMNPYEVKMPKAGLDMCLSCHNSQHSPGFDPQTYWEAIEH